MRGIEQIPWLYDTGMSLLEMFGLGRWRRRLLQGAQGRVLEIGCGTGRNLPRYPAGAWVVGLDPDLAALRTARRRAPHAPLVVARAEALPFKKTCFDVVVSSLVFCSVDDPRQSLVQVGRVLTPVGELRMLEHVRARSAFWAAVQDRIQPFWTCLTGGCHPNRDTEAVVQAAGFNIEGGRRSRGVLRAFTAHRRVSVSP